jgi:steroid 5-alpha reductase family enzyme
VSAFPWSALLTNLGVTALAVLLVMVGAWATGVWARGGRHDGVDVVWGLGFALVAVTSLALSSGDGETWRRWLVTGLTAVWGLRLAGHIHRRNRGKDEDRRYQEMLAGAPGDPRWYVLRTVYLTQGAVMWLVSLPVQLAQYGRGDTLLGGSWSIGTVAAVLGVAVWLLGFGFETVGDAQLAAFTADPANQGQVLDRGLWRYTRHPNYFGDACVWIGLALLALHHPPGLAGLLSAALMTWLLARGTGASLLESTIGDRRPGYADYIARTSGFVPLPPKRTTRRAQA